MQNKKRIPANENVAYQRWEMPDLTGVRRRIAQRLDELQAEETEDSSAEAIPQPPTAEEIEALREEARQRGFSTGFEEGRQQGYEEGRALGYQEGEATGQESGFQAGYQRGLDQAQHEVDQQLARLQGLIEQLQGPLQQLDQEVEDALLSLVDLISRSLLRREISLDRSFLAEVLKESVAALPAGHQRLRIFLNPDDMPLAEAACQDLLEEYRLVGDPGVAPGGARIETLQSLVDSTLENRYKKIIDSLMEGGYKSADVDLQPLPQDVFATPDTAPLDELSFQEPAPAAPIAPTSLAPDQPATAEESELDALTEPAETAVPAAAEAVSRVSLQRSGTPRNIPALDAEKSAEPDAPEQHQETLDPQQKTPEEPVVSESVSDPVVADPELVDTSVSAESDSALPPVEENITSEQPDTLHMTEDEEDDFFEKALDNLVQSAQEETVEPTEDLPADSDGVELEDFLDSFSDSAESTTDAATDVSAEPVKAVDKVWAPESVHDDRYLEDVLENTWLDDLNEDQGKSSDPDDQEKLNG
ncbi:MAG: hypothetical protein IBX50_01150 [Marinospirillum sp.]|uniref:FliH/SctL family protein n=1 Tax=Marinospirillum sp. TaxID=2183934 RepID=UPI001A066708|nr:FliH/SctL family protein [Marinospirillum sp.]MBE0505309.1 hypothetical protein [Marinospirillum sp.]